MSVLLGHAQRRVVEELLHQLQVPGRPERARRARVAQVVQPEVGDTSSGEGSSQGGGEPVVGDRVAAAAHELPVRRVAGAGAPAQVGEHRRLVLVAERPPGADQEDDHRDHIISLEDGKPYKSLKRHLTTRGLTPEDYRRKWGLPHDYPMVAANYAAQRSELAKASGLGSTRNRKAA